MLSPTEAKSLVERYATSDNAAQASYDVNALSQIEEGTALLTDKAQLLVDKGHGVKLPTYSLSDIRPIVPKCGTYPAHFIALASVTTGATVGKSLLLFSRDDKGSAWRLAAFINQQAELPDFKIDSRGYGEELDTQAQGQLVAAGPGLAQAYANYLSNGWLGTHLYNSAPDVTFAPGPYTDSMLRTDTNSVPALAILERNHGATVTGHVLVNDAWVFRLRDGTALDLFTETVALEITALPGGTIQLTSSLGGFVQPGTVDFLGVAFTLMAGARDPLAHRGSQAVGVPLEDSEYIGGCTIQELCTAVGF